MVLRWTSCSLPFSALLCSSTHPWFLSRTPLGPSAIFSHFLPIRMLVAVISSSFRIHRPTEKGEKKKPTAFCSFKFLENTFLFLPRKQICLLLVLVFIQQITLGVSTLCLCLGALPLFHWGLQLGPFPVTGSCGAPRHTLGHFCTWGSRVTSS